MRLDEVQAAWDTLHAREARLPLAFLHETRARRLHNWRAFRGRQGPVLESAKRKLGDAWEALAKLSEQSESVQNRLEDRQERVRSPTEELVGVKEKHFGPIERRKELWREDARSTSAVGHVESELRQHEWDLASPIGQGGGGQGQRVQ